MVSILWLYTFFLGSRNAHTVEDSVSEVVEAYVVVFDDLEKVSDANGEFI